MTISFLQTIKKFSTELSSKFSEKRKENTQNQWTIILDALGYLGCVALIIYVAFRWGAVFFDPYLQNDDTRMVIFPLWALHEDVFIGDYITQIMSGFQTPWLHKSFYYIFTFVFDLLTVTKIAQILAVAWGGFHMFRIGHRRAGGLGGLFSLYLVFHTYILLERAGGGLPRAFGLPIILMTVDGIDKNSDRQSGLGGILGFAIYPPAGLIALTTHCIWLTVQFIVNKIDLFAFRKVMVKLGVVTLLCFLSISPLLISRNVAGKLYSLEQARLMPEFGMTGRTKILPLKSATTVIARDIERMSVASDDSPLPFLKKFSSKIGGVLPYLFISFALLLAVVGLARPPYISLYVAIAGIVLFGLANLIAFRLYYPERMISLALPAAVLYLLSSTFTGIKYKISQIIVSRLSSLVIMFVFIGFMGVTFKGPIGLNVNANSEKELYRFLQTLPEDALFAGHPTRMDNIPLWAKRRILVSNETSNTWFDEAWEEMKERTYDNFDAYYASNPGPLIALRKKYGVDYMLVHEVDISPYYSKSCNYFEPFTAWVKQLCQKPNTDLIWRKATSTSVVGKASYYYVIDLDIFIAQLNPS